MIALPVLWLYGASGVGKTTVTWELFRQLAAEGRPTGYVDIDQLGMCYGPPTPQEWAPEPAADPGRHRLKSRTLNAVVANFRAAGARCVLVPGVTDPVRGVEFDLVPHAAMTTCRLRADPVELARRLVTRNGAAADLTEELAYADALDRAFPTDLCVDTTALTVAEVVDRVRARTGWPDRVAPDAVPLPAPAPLPMPAPRGEPPPIDEVRGPAPGEILWLCGPAAVGKSTVGWEVYQRARQAGVRAAFVDLDQIGFLRPAAAGDPGRHRLKAANLAAVWQAFRDSGADCLIAVGPLDRPTDLMPYTAALPAATITLCQLYASLDVLVDRAARRGQGLSPARGLAGDELIGRAPEQLRGIAIQAARTLDGLDGVGDLRVDTDGRPADEIAAEILTRTNWPSLR